MIPDHHIALLAAATAAGGQEIGMYAFNRGRYFHLFIQRVSHAYAHVVAILRHAYHGQGDNGSSVEVEEREGRGVKKM